jgi:hypothetical protein
MVFRYKGALTGFLYLWYMEIDRAQGVLFIHLGQITGCYYQTGLLDNNIRFPRL